MPIYEDMRMATRKKKANLNENVRIDEGDGFKPGMRKSEVYAKAIISLPVQASETFKRVVKTDEPMNTTDLVKVMRDLGKDVSAGKMDYLERMLVSQTVLLDALFNNLTNRALGSEYQKNFENILKLAFKAQSQARCTAEALALIKNPAPYIRQANISQGHQQVNNTYAPMQSDADATTKAHAGKSQSVPNKLLEETDGNRLELGKTAETGRVNPSMEAVA